MPAASSAKPNSIEGTSKDRQELILQKDTLKATLLDNNYIKLA